MPELSDVQKRKLEEKEKPGGMLESYIFVLRLALKSFPLLEREAIVEEVRQHIRDKAQTAGMISGESLAKTLKEFGEPDEIAAKYKARAWLVKASTSWNPWVIFRAATSWAKVGGKGIRAAFIVFLGYGLAFLSFVCATLKHFLAWRFEYEVGRAVELITNTPAANNSTLIDFLVAWMPVLGVAVGIFFFIVTTAIVRSMVRRVAGPKT